jgi:hypothetical protein
MVKLNVIAALLAECVAAALMLSGFFAHLGGMLGLAAMLPAIDTTFVLKGSDPAHLPARADAGPVCAPLPLPIMVLLGSLAVLILGAWAWSVDAAMQQVIGKLGHDCHWRLGGVVGCMGVWLSPETCHDKLSMAIQRRWTSASASV